MSSSVLLSLFLSLPLSFLSSICYSCPQKLGSPSPHPIFTFTFLQLKRKISTWACRMASFSHKPLFKKLQHICVPSWFFSWQDLLGTRRHYLREPVFVYPAYLCSSNPTLCVCTYTWAYQHVCVLLAWMCSVFYICRCTGKWVYVCMCVCAYRHPMLMLVVFEDSTHFFLLKHNLACLAS